jgi:anti-sigma factor ChrR (cupin superfamily)
MKPALEFFDASTVPWTEVSPGIAERRLAHDPESGMLTRLLRWDPGLEVPAALHDYVEEVLILRGSMRDLRLDETFAAGWYACRPPGMEHGPWVSEEGCEMLEIRYRP